MFTVALGSGDFGILLDKTLFYGEGGGQAADAYHPELVKSGLVFTYDNRDEVLLLSNNNNKNNGHIYIAIFDVH
jgi:alanyl-tRNA synthetase